MSHTTRRHQTADRRCPVPAFVLQERSSQRTRHCGGGRDGHGARDACEVERGKDRLIVRRDKQRVGTDLAMHEADAFTVAGMNLGQRSQGSNRELTTLRDSPAPIFSSLRDGRSAGVDERKVTQFAGVIGDVVKRVHQTRHTGQTLQLLQGVELATGDAVSLGNRCNYQHDGNNMPASP